MAGGPALLLANVEQYGVNTLLGRRARIQVIGEYLVAVIQTVVNNDLLALKVGVTERRCNIDDRTRLVALGLLCAYKALQMYWLPPELNGMRISSCVLNQSMVSRRSLSNL